MTAKYSQAFYFYFKMPLVLLTLCTSNSCSLFNQGAINNSSNEFTSFNHINLKSIK